jgi:hypothetical protein
LLRFRSRILDTVFRGDETAGLPQRNRRRDIGFLDDIRQGRCNEGTRGLFASAFRSENRLRSHAGRGPAPCRFQRCTVGHQRADRLYDEDPKDPSCVLRWIWKKLGVRCKAEGKQPPMTPGLSFAAPPKDELDENCIKWRRAGPHLHYAPYRPTVRRQSGWRFIIPSDHFCSWSFGGRTMGEWLFAPSALGGSNWLIMAAAIIACFTLAWVARS